MKEKMARMLAIVLTVLMLFPAANVQASSVKLAYNGKTTTYSGKQLKVAVNGKSVNISKTPGIIQDGYALISYVETFKKQLGVKTSYNKNTQMITLTYEGNTVKLKVNSKEASVNGTKTTAPVASRIVTYKVSGITKILVPSQFVSTSLGIPYSYSSSNATIALGTTVGAAGLMDIQYGGNTYAYEGSQLKLVAGNSAVSTNMPGLILDEVVMVPANKTYSGSLKASYTYNSKEKKVTIVNGSKTITMIMGSTTAEVNGVATTMPRAAELVTKVSTGSNFVMVPGEFVSKKLGYDYSFDSSTKQVTITDPNATDELKAMWISYLDIGSSAKTEKQWKTKVDKMFDNCVDLGMNAVIVQVRPTGDALYESSYFPWSQYASGTQGKNPGYDPLAYMVTAAKARNLEIHAWINPYRVSQTSTDVTKLSKDNQARKWRESGSSSKKRNVLTYDGKLYYNPAKKEVQDLIVNGVVELVKNYNLDGIHFDDYFYPSFTSSNVSTAFDAAEYKASGSSLSIANWRRKNINTLVARVYKEIKAIDSTVEFGISPAGNLSNLRSNYSYYVDIDTWMTKTGYVDYICPQIYWGFENGNYSFDKVLKQWVALNKNKKVDLYVGIPNYKAGTSNTSEWKNNNDILGQQITYSRNTGATDGFMFFRYDDFYRSSAAKETANLLKVLNP